MHRVCLLFCLAAATAQNYDNLEPRSVSFPSKGSLGPLYVQGLSSSSGYRDNSYEDNAVTPTPTPVYRQQQQPVRSKIYKINSHSF